MKTLYKYGWILVLAFIIGGAGFQPQILQRGCHHLSSSTTTTCTLADTYYKVTGTWTDGANCNNAFEYDGSGKITYTGKSGTYFLSMGS